MRRGPLAALLLASLLPPAAAAEEGSPLPVARTAKVGGDKAVLTVEGRVRVPRGVEVTILRNTIVRAKGSGPAVIEVEGQLDAVGVLGLEIIFENVTVEPQPKNERIHLDMCLFRGGGGVRTPRDVPVEGYILVDNVDFLAGSAVDLLYRAGTVSFLSTCAEAPVRIRSPQKDGKTDPVRISVSSCDQLGTSKCTPHSRRWGLRGGLEIDGGDDVTLHSSRTAGALTAVRNWGRRLIFDSMKVNSEKLEFSHREAGKYALAQCAKCDLYCKQLKASGPRSERTSDRLVLDRCWFKGRTDPKEIQEKVIGDGTDDPANNGVKVVLVKVGDRPLELAGEEDR